MTKYTWTNSDGGSWFTSTNWSPNGTPEAGDAVAISIPASFSAPTVTASGEPIDVASITVSDASLAFTGALGNKVKGNLDWLSGSSGSLSIDDASLVVGGALSCYDLNIATNDPGEPAKLTASVAYNESRGDGPGFHIDKGGSFFLQDLYNFGKTILQHAKGVVAGVLQGEGEVYLTQDSSLVLGGVVGFGRVDTEGGDDHLTIKNSAEYRGSVGHFHGKDTIDLTQFDPDTIHYSYQDGALSVASGADKITIHLFGRAYSAPEFHFAPDSGSGTLVTYL